MPEVSVIIPNYNHAAFLTERINSVLNQTFQDFEVILMDDCSTDNSQEIISAYQGHSKVREIIYNKHNSGSPFKQWKKGIEASSGEWIWLAESDDKASPEFLLRMLECAKKIHNISLIYCDSEIKSHDTEVGLSYSKQKNDYFHTNKWSHSYYHNGIDEINESLKWQCTINNASATLCRREIAIKYIDQLSEFRYHGDWMFYLLLAGGGNIGYIPEKLNLHRRHDNNHTHNSVPEQASRIEKFRILNHLMQLPGIKDKKKMFRFFVQNHVGYGILSGPAFGKQGYYKRYAEVNPALSKKLMLALFTNHFLNKESI